jgi:hypothetical protein
MYQLQLIHLVMCQRGKMNLRDPQILISLGVSALGIVIVFLCIIAFGEKIQESAALALGIGIYFLGLNLLFRAADKPTSVRSKELSDKERDDRLQNIERIVEQWDRDRE